MKTLVQFFQSSSAEIHVALAFTPIWFNAPCQYTAVLNLRLLIFSLMHIGWLHSIMLTCSYPIVCYGNICFDLRVLFQEHD